MWKTSIMNAVFLTAGPKYFRKKILVHRHRQFATAGFDPWSLQTRSQRAWDEPSRPHLYINLRVILIAEFLFALYSIVLTHQLADRKFKGLGVKSDCLGGDFWFWSVRDHHHHHHHPDGAAIQT